MKKTALVLALSLLSVAASIAPALAIDPSNEDYIFEIEKKHPKVLSAWKWTVPKSFQKVTATYKNGSTSPWIANLDGTSGPVDKMLLHNKQFVLGSMCWPHNCGGNHVAFLIAMDGSAAYGLLSSETLKEPEQYFGRPSDEMTKLLKTEMKNQLMEGDKYFTTYK
jgi:Inhibitor of vertebrate lysozyme (Ivy)